MWPFISWEQAGCFLHYAKLSFWKVYRFVMCVTQGDLRPKKWVKNTHSSSTSVQRWQLDLSDLPYQKRAEEEKSGCRMRSHSDEGHREGEGKGVMKAPLGGCTCETMLHLGVRVEGREVWRSQRFTAQLNPSFTTTTTFFSFSLSLSRLFFLLLCLSPFYLSLSNFL